jgi:hypothetical protein
MLPPSTRAIVVVAGMIGFAVALFVAVDMGAFREELHPDPTRGSYALPLAVIFGFFSFGGGAAAMWICRWLFWPANRRLYAVSCGPRRPNATVAVALNG